MFQRNFGRAGRAALLLAALVTAGWAIPNPAPPDAALQPGAKAAMRAGGDPFVDPLDAPAIMHARIAEKPVMAIARAGARLVAVGLRGLIIVSDDGGNSWAQVAVPVRSDLLSLSFPTARDGWAVGHDGVVLHTADAGNTWVRQFDGRIAAKTLVGWYGDQIAEGNASLKPYLDQLILNYKLGPSLPLLSVWFRDPQYGIAVGPFGTVIATVDGGKTWRPSLERIDNPEFLHLNAVYGVAGRVYLAAEKGTIFRLDNANGRFVAVSTGYAGSFFGITGTGHALYAYGLRGTIYRSTDQGEQWVALKSPLHGAVTGAAPIDARHAVAFVTSSGEAALYDEVTDAFHPLKAGQPVALTSVLPLGGDRLAFTSLGGTRFVSAR